MTTTHPIRFPAQLCDWPTGIAPFLGQLLGHSERRVVCDGSALKFVLPVGLCGLAAACDTLATRGHELDFTHLPGNIENYFERMDVFKHCHVEHDSRNRRNDLAGSLVELRCLSSAGEVAGAAQALGSAITGQVMRGRDDSEDPEGMRPRPSERIADHLRYILSELLENALTHAQANGFGHAKVWVAAMYFAGNGTVRLGVVDNGCGFLASLRTNVQVAARPSHSRAVLTALEPFVSCNKAVGILDDSSNQGIGLTVCRDIAGAAGGWLEVNSGDASVLARAAQHQLQSTAPWQGAALDVLVYRDRLLGLDLRSVVRPYQREPRPRLRFE